MKTKSFIQIAAICCVVLCAGLTTNTANAQERKITFAWGAEIGGDLDMTSHNMSSIGINAKLGFSWKWIRFLGIGAQGDFMVSNSDRAYPLYLNFRTDFSKTKKLMFLDLRGGMALTSFTNLEQKTAGYFSGGVGITLAEGKSFSSHIILGYTYLGQDKCYNGVQLRKCPGLSMASLRLGITFQANSTTEAPKIEKEVAQPTPPRVVRTTTPPPAVKRPIILPDTNYPEFINASAGVIEMPASCDVPAWRSFAADLDNALRDGKQIDIVHIGDSHIQAEMVTSRLRELLQSRYGNAGRGLISAFKLAGTNQPVDYAITSEFPTDSQARLLKRPWPIEPGFTGVASSSNRSNKITFKNLKEGHNFNQARIFTSEGDRKILWIDPIDSASFYALPGERVYGIYTKNMREPGLIYSTIGNNGACFSDYLLIDGFASDVAKLNPRLIILSMGTNEAYSSKTDKQIAQETRKLIKKLRDANPNAVFMLWTPMECHKKNENDEFVICDKVRDVRNIMMDVARREGVAIWDFYEVAGGYGSAEKWLGEEMMNSRDHVHLLNKGYRLQGDLAASALIAFLESLK